MLGVTHYTGNDTSLEVRFKAKGKGGINCFKVTLEPSDTYTVEFFRVGQIEWHGERGWHPKGKVEDVYCDNLVETIEGRIGLCLHF